MRDLRFPVRRTQFRNSPLVTTGEVRTILGTGPGKGVRIERFVRPSEIPRPSSRETAMPPRWVSGRGGHGRDQPSVRSGSPLTLRAERTEAGPGREQTCQQNRSDAGSGPRGEVATHFVGLLVIFLSPSRTVRRSTDAGSQRKGWNPQEPGPMHDASVPALFLIADCRLPIADCRLLFRAGKRLQTDFSLGRVNFFFAAIDLIDGRPRCAP